MACVFAMICLQGLAVDNWGEVRAYISQRTEMAPVVDGRLDDVCWERADRAEGFVPEGAGRDGPAERTGLCIVFIEYPLHVCAAFDRGISLATRGGPVKKRRRARRERPLEGTNTGDAAAAR